MPWCHESPLNMHLLVFLKSGELVHYKLDIPSFMFYSFSDLVGELLSSRARGRHLPTRARGLARVHNVFPALSTADARYLSTRSGLRTCSPRWRRTHSGWRSCLLQNDDALVTGAE